MSFIIKGMDKPKSCRTCKFTSPKEGECWFVHDPNYCPLVEVIECKDCKWSYIDERDEILWCKVHMSHYRVNDNGFCSEGERRMI